MEHILLDEWETTDPLETKFFLKQIKILVTAITEQL